VPALHVITLLSGDDFRLVVLVVEVELKVVNRDRGREVDRIDEGRESAVGVLNVIAEGLHAGNGFLVVSINPLRHTGVFESLVTHVVGREQAAFPELELKYLLDGLVHVLHIGLDERLNEAVFARRVGHALLVGLEAETQSVGQRSPAEQDQGYVPTPHETAETERGGCQVDVLHHVMTDPAREAEKRYLVEGKRHFGTGEISRVDPLADAGRDPALGVIDDRVVIVAKVDEEGVDVLIREVDQREESDLPGLVEIPEVHRQNGGGG